MRVRHPNAIRGGALRPPVAIVGPDGIERTPDDDGYVEAPEAVARELAERWSRRFGPATDVLLAEPTDDADADDEPRCQYCGESFSAAGLPQHEAHCDEQPD